MIAPAAVTVLLAACSVAAASRVAAQRPVPADTVPITEWQVPWEKTRPRDPFVDPTEPRVWFVGQEGNYVAYLTPKTGQFKRYELPDGTNPHNVILAPDGGVWYSGNRNGRIGKLDARTGKVTEYMMPDAAARDPHTLVFDQRGDLWFTVQGGNYVGKLTTATGRVQLLKVPTPRARPYGIVVDSKNRIWFNEFGANKIGSVDPNTMALREYSLPNENARGRRIAVTSDDKVWYVDYTRGFLGRLDPATGKVDEWAAPSAGRSLPYAMTVDDRDRLWFVETGVQPNRLVGFDSKTQQFFGITAVGSGGGTIRHMIFHKPTGDIWFGSDVNTIGRAQVSRVAPKPKIASE
ncbi:MAG: hypothetical protein WKG32_06735 [Gemmatimonadaceae bacterium]